MQFLLCAPPLDDRAAFKYCLDLVRAHDYENYLCTLALPTRARHVALALRAFNVETANALGAASEPHLASMRLQFWRDALPAIHAGDASKHRHPVAVALSRVLPAGGARAKRWLNSIVDARMKVRSIHWFPYDRVRVVNADP